MNFAPAVTYLSGGYEATSIAVADVNGDGKPDMLVANLCVSLNCNPTDSGMVGVFLGNGDGTFQTAVAYGSGGMHANSVVVADVNGDSKPDLIVVNICADNNCNNGSVAVLLGNGDGTFQTAVSYGSGGFQPFSVAVADVNGDGKPDILVANPCVASDACGTANQEFGSVGVLLGKGDGTFQTVVTYSSGSYVPYSVVVADVNGDGKPDIEVANLCEITQYCNSGVVSVLLGNGDGTFQTAATYGSGGLGAISVAVADVNGDSKPDIVVANQCSSSGCISGGGVVGVLLGNGDGTFQTAVAYLSGGYEATSIAVADVNGDSKPDIVVANSCTSSNNCRNQTSPVGVLLGNGDGTFQTAVTYSSGAAEAVSVAAADVNGDGKPDIVVANEQCTGCNGAVGVLINTSLTATKTALVSSPNPSNVGQAVTFTATVTAQPGFDKGTPTGTVSFSDGTTQLGSSTLNGSGVATLTISTLAVGTHSITAAYKGDTNFVPSTSVVLSQVVQGAIVQLSATSLSFGNQTVGISSAAKGLTLTNKGNIALAISSIGISGTNSGDFAQTNNCPGSIAPNGTCTISVTFKPTATGTRTAAVSIADNAPKSPQTVSLSGVGVLPTVTFSPTSLTFPTQVVFTTSKAETVKLTNSGLGILKITKVAVAGPFTQTNNCGTTVNPGASCTLTVTFKPTTIGVLTGSISMTDNAPGSPQKITLKGTGTAIELTPASVNFGNQPVGTKSLTKTITLTNQGHATVSITGITITGANVGDFSQTHTCGTSLASGASCFIHVTFKPTATGTRTATVSVSDNSGGSPQKVSLTGTGT